MDGFTGYKSAALEAIEKVTIVMDPFHVVALAGDKLDECRQRLQQETLDRRGHTGDPLYGIRRTAKTRSKLLTKKQWFRLLNVFSQPEHAAFEATWSAYQEIIDAYQSKKPKRGKKIMVRLIDTIMAGLPDGLVELQVRWPTIPILFGENRKLSEEWTYRYLAAAHAWAESEGPALARMGTGQDADVRDEAVLPTPSTTEVRTWARTQGLTVSDRGRLRPEIHQAWQAAHRSPPETAESLASDQKPPFKADIH